MESDYPRRYLEKLYRHHFFHKWDGWREEIFQIMWKALFEANIRYRRYRCCCDFEDYAEAVIVKKVNRWMKQNNRYYYRYLSLDKPFVDSEETMLSTYIAADDMFCSIELYDFISRLSFIKYAVCKGYILQYFDEEIAYKLHITLKQLEEIKLELQQDFTVEYLL